MAVGFEQMWVCQLKAKTESADVEGMDELLVCRLGVSEGQGILGSVNYDVVDVERSSADSCLVADMMLDIAGVVPGFVVLQIGEMDTGSY